MAFQYPYKEINWSILQMIVTMANATDSKELLTKLFTVFDENQ